VSKKVKVWSPTGELKEVAPLNANDLVLHLGYSRLPPVVAGAAAKPAAKTETPAAAVTPNPDGSDEERQAWLDNIGEGSGLPNTNDDEDEA